MLTAQQFQNLLTDLDPYVFVVGSYANNSNRLDSDLDLYVRPVSGRIHGEADYSKLDKIKGILTNYGLAYDQDYPTQFHVTQFVPIILDIEAIHGVHIQQGASIVSITICGVPMSAII